MCRKIAKVGILVSLFNIKTLFVGSCFYGEKQNNFIIKSICSSGKTEMELLAQNELLHDQQKKESAYLMTFDDNSNIIFVKSS